MALKKIRKAFGRFQRYREDSAERGLQREEREAGRNDRRAAVLDRQIALEEKRARLANIRKKSGGGFGGGMDVMGGLWGNNNSGNSGNTDIMGGFWGNSPTSTPRRRYSRPVRRAARRTQNNGFDPFRF